MNVSRLNAASTQPTRHRGFTLIELLLAMAIFAIVLLAINTVFYSAVRLERATTQALDERLPLNQALAVLRRDLQGAVPPNTNSVSYCDFISGAGRGGMGSSAASTLEFCTTTGVIRDDAPWGDRQRVRYELRTAADRNASRGQDLFRVVTRNLLPVATEDATDQWLMGNVESVNFSCYDGSGWRDAWDTSTGDTGLPLAVRVEIQLAANNNTGKFNSQPITLLVPLDTQARTNQAATATATGGTP